MELQPYCKSGGMSIKKGEIDGGHGGLLRLLSPVNVSIDRCSLECTRCQRFCSLVEHQERGPWEHDLLNFFRVRIDQHNSFQNTWEKYVRSHIDSLI